MAEKYYSVSKDENAKDAVEIKIAIRDIRDFYKASDYSAFTEQSLNDELEKYILKCVRVYPASKKVKLVISVPDKHMLKDSLQLPSSIHKHFSYRVIDTEVIMSQKIHQWKINMIIGILFLILCLITVQLLDPYSDINAVKIAKESISIIGWVALWEPLSFVFFGWQSVKSDKQYYKKLSTVPVEVISYIARGHLYSKISNIH
jgi:hypothetical protein